MATLTLRFYHAKLRQKLKFTTFIIYTQWHKENHHRFSTTIQNSSHTVTLLFSEAAAFSCMSFKRGTPFMLPLFSSLISRLEILTLFRTLYYLLIPLTLLMILTLSPIFYTCSSNSYPFKNTPKLKPRRRKNPTL